MTIMSNVLYLQMDVNVALVLVLAVASVCVQVQGVSRRVCFYSGWAVYRQAPNALKPQEIDPNLCTHINYAFASLDDNGTQLIVNADEIPRMLELTGLKLKNPNLKVMISVGGWNMGSELFQKTVSDSAHMMDFAMNTVKFLRIHNFDGLDIDWEYPAARGSPDSDKDAFGKLLQVVHTVFVGEPNRGSKDQLLLSVAASPTQYRMNKSYNVTALATYCDFINLMMYDFHGQWEDFVNVHSALYSKSGDLNIADMLRVWEARGVPRDKMVIGVPFYGHTFQLNYTDHTDVGAEAFGGGSVPYFDICQLLSNDEVQEHMLSVERVPYIVVNGTDWIGYDNIQSITEKAAFVHDNHYGGVMTWSIDLDDISGACGAGKFPLTHALIQGLNGQGGSPIG